jgi:DNA helicase-2/ATP-dependent DNA helicase PcrA
MKSKNWTKETIFKKEMKKDILSISGLSEKAKKNLSGTYFDKIVDSRQKEGNPFTVGYIFSRMTSVDWSVLDLFYQLNGFKHFREMYKLAEDGTDEAPICNLGLITQYLSRFMDEHSTVITAFYLSEHRFVNKFFLSYVYALWRLGESEYEDSDDPFPKGRVPFLTIHQSKGLEFPVVILGSIFKKPRGASKTETVIRVLKPETDGEPLERIGVFDTMRMFYVGLSRAKNLMVLPQYKGGSSANSQFKDLFQSEHFDTIQNFDFSTLPASQVEENEVSRNYSYTSDYLNYLKCPRNYMIFRRYNFVPSRSQTMFFGSLVHQTIEDLHNYLIHRRSSSNV